MKTAQEIEQILRNSYKSKHDTPLLKIKLKSENEIIIGKVACISDFGGVGTKYNFANSTITINKSESKEFKKFLYSDIEEINVV
jgi:hypothetical protein